MHLPASRSPKFSGIAARWLMTAVIFSPFLSPPPLSAEPPMLPPRAERVANRIAERRYARMSIAEARAARAEARVAEIAPVVPVPPPPRPATVRRMARAGVPLAGPPPAVIVAGPQSVRKPAVAPRSLAGTATAIPAPPAPQPLAAAAPAIPATPSRPAPPTAAEPGVWTLAPEDAVTSASAEVSPDGTRSVLSAGGAAAAAGAAATPPAGVRPDPAVTQPGVELLPTPEAN